MRSFKLIFKLLARLVFWPFRGLSGKDVPDRPKKILLLMCNWLGDTFWAMQVILAIKKRYPDTEIFVGCKPFSTDLLQGLIDSDHIIQIKNVVSDRHRELFHPKDFVKEILAVRKLKINLLIDLTCNPFSALFCCFSGAGYKIGGLCDDFNFVYNSFSNSKLFAGQHLSRRPFIITQTEFSGKWLTPVCKESLKLNIESCRYAVIMPGAGWATKVVPENIMIEIGNYITDKNIKVFICCKETEKETFAGLQNEIHGAEFFCRSFMDAIILVRESVLYVGGDTGLTHIAAAMGTATIALFCSTNPRYAAPLGKKVTLFQPACTIQSNNEKEQCINSLCVPNCPLKEWMQFDLDMIKKAVDGYCS